MPIRSGNHVDRKTGKSVRRENQPESSETGKELSNPKQTLAEEPDEFRAIGTRQDSEIRHFGVRWSEKL
jgi:hypothetical protein